MSGGHWDYLQYRLTEVIEDLDRLIQCNGGENAEREETPFEPRFSEDYYTFSPEVISEFKRGLDIIAKAQVYMQRMDWLLSGDDGEESFLKRLSEDLTKLKQYEN